MSHTTQQLNCEVIDGRIDLVLLNQLNPSRYPYLLESTSTPAVAANDKNHDILFAFPGDALIKNNHHQLKFNDKTLNDRAFLTNLDKYWVSEQRLDKADAKLPFTGGWFLFLSYELANEIEPTLAELKRPSDSLPIAVATRIHAAVIYSHAENKTYVVSEADHPEYIQQIMNDINSCEPACSNKTVKSTVTEEDENLYLCSVEKIKRYITDGDVFQVNLSRKWSATYKEQINPVELYRKLKQSNPGGFSGFVRYGQHAIISSSPERLVKTEGTIVSTRPIAGTRPRGKDKQQDQQLSNELIVNEKEQAEHIMLIDLERNDLGRICQPGTIEVDEKMTIESYAHVHHIVSNIHGQIKNGCSPGEVIRAVFPGGTITGCPKVRCMEIISELEASPRQAYTGSFGYLNHNGDMDLNILIRSITATENNIEFRAGAGIVADSNAEAELAETRDKARGLLRALQASEQETHNESA